MTRANSLGMSGHQSPNRGASQSWITPRWIIDALGPFDLDPCQCDRQPWPCAARGLTKADDGLSAPWSGRVWLNPPYSGRYMGAWLARLADHGSGTALVFARTETEAFHRHVWERASGILFIEGRLTFHRPDGTPAPFNGGAPSCLVAYGEDDATRLESSGIRGAFVPLSPRMGTVQWALEFPPRIEAAP